MSPSVPSPADTLLLSPAPDSPQLVPVSMLEPLELTPPAQFPPETLLATIVFCMPRLPGLSMPPPLPAPLLAMVTFFSVADPVTSFSMPPPSVTAVLPLMVTFVRLRLPSLSMAPPAASDWLPLSVTFVSVAVPMLYRAPPLLWLLQPEIVTSVAVIVPSFTMPPPPRRPTLFRMRTLVNVSVPLFQIPPATKPNPENPSVMVSADMLTPPAPGMMSNTRSMLLASMIVEVTPAPTMLIGLVMSRSPVAAASSVTPGIVSV